MRTHQTAPTVRIGLFVQPDLGVRREVLRGVAAYAEGQPTWELELLWRYFDGLKSMNFPGVDGWIAWPEKPENLPVLQRLTSRGICVGHYPITPHPRIKYDNEQIGRQIFQYFHERGLRHFGAYCERLFMDYSQERLGAFREELSERGQSCPTFDARIVGADPISWNQTQAAVEEWLYALPKPVGILADTDVAGYNLITACRHAGISVPDEVAVVSVGADDLVCELCKPRLSSVSLNGFQAGWKAAELLKSYLAKASRPPDYLMVPQSIVERGSSNIIAFQDPYVVRVIRFVEDHFRENIGVPELVVAAGLSRRALEKRFIKETGRTLLEQIFWVRRRHAEELLSYTEIPIAEVAERSGFGEPRRFSEFFKKTYGQTPRQYRQFHLPSGG